MSTSAPTAGLNPIYNFLEISTNEPILSSKASCDRKNNTACLGLELASLPPCGKAAVTTDYLQAEPEHIDAKNDLLAPFKVSSHISLSFRIDLLNQSNLEAF